MDLHFQYLKKRKNFGRQLEFSMVHPQMLDSIHPDVQEQKLYSLRNPVCELTQASTSQSQQHINTIRVEYEDTGMNHEEGGWPKDVNPRDEEQASRLRKREEREVDYINAVLNSYPRFERFIKQNNNISMYQMYYKELPTVPPVEKSSMRINNCRSDPTERPVSCLAWTKENDSKLLASYCHKVFSLDRTSNKVLTGCVWNLENTSPEFKFMPPTACWQLDAHPISPKIIVGGLADGTVCLFDIRENSKPVNISPIHNAHRDPITALIYMQSRTNSEFFTGSTDGVCKWWDVRNLEYPTEELIISVRVPPGEKSGVGNSEGVSCLQYDRAMPTRFLCGTDTGLVINVNRKGKTDKETFTCIITAHAGRVRTIQRSPCTSKMFLTCGNWSVHVWSDDVPISPIITGVSQRKQINDAVWSPHRVSSYMTVSADGFIQCWDLLRKYKEPVLKLFLSKQPLLKLKPNEDGTMVAVGDAKGMINILSLSENLVQSRPDDKQLMVQAYERETRREHILENRVKEIRLRLRDDEVPPPLEEVIDEDALVMEAENAYRKMVAQESFRTGASPPTITAIEKPKKPQQR